MENQYMKECIENVRRNVFNLGKAKESVEELQPPQFPVARIRLHLRPVSLLSSNEEASPAESLDMVSEGHEENSSVSVVDPQTTPPSQADETAEDASESPALDGIQDEINGAERTLYLVCENSPFIYVYDQRQMNAETTIGSVVSTQLFTAKVTAIFSSESEAKENAKCCALSKVGVSSEDSNPNQ